MEATTLFILDPPEHDVQCAEARAAGVAETVDLRGLDRPFSPSGFEWLRTHYWPRMNPADSVDTAPLTDPDAIVWIALVSRRLGDHGLWERATRLAADRIIASPLGCKPAWREALGFGATGGHATHRAETEVAFGQCWVQLNGRAMGDWDPGRTWGLTRIEEYQERAEEYRREHPPPKEWPGQ